ncbi:hypothetical protein [Nocardia mangyaensis]|uniref:hypothetical protein n=1 Tax=Nocardia mangyaensis TaxID=2213200 RepID=UPI00267647FF|nr:hypothetical protein [Nocardia mangyaensis]MDO3645723.1 hypothetical protein [Nocardia mangyaensis]
MRIAGLTALAAGALILPAFLAPAASAEVEDITIYAYGNSEVPVGCDYVGANCSVMARMFGPDYALPATVTVNGRELDSPERLDYPDLQRSAIRGTWRPPAKGTYTIVATQGSSTKTLVVEVTGDPQLGSGSAGLLPGSS